jgi:hypothetical protein
MTRKFEHRFDPAALSPVPTPGDVELTVQEIEAAGIEEILQRSGAKIGSWSLLDALLEPGDSRFRFREPLGAAREVKVAASGLFGRFVARAYLSRYFKLAFFENLGTKYVVLNKARRLEIRRKRGKRGDLPDWVACSGSLNNITVAEAKGCHDKDGPKNTMNRAWEQASRVDVIDGGRRLTVKRIAIATRWGSKIGGSYDPIIAVRDPQDEGDPEADKFAEHGGVGLARLHIANLLEPLGYPELAQSIRGMTTGRQMGKSTPALVSTRKLLTDARTREVRDGSEANAPEIGPLIGAFMTRAGPISQDDISSGEIETLRLYGLQPMFVGIEREVIDAVIGGNPEQIQIARRRENPVRRGDLFVNLSGTCVAHVGRDVRIA